MRPLCFQLSPGVHGTLQGGDALPEALQADARRLAEAQAGFQRLLVGVAAALLLRQHAAAAARHPLPAGVQGCIPSAVKNCMFQHPFPVEFTPTCLQ